MDTKRIPNNEIYDSPGTALKHLYPCGVDRSNRDILLRHEIAHGKSEECRSLFQCDPI